MAQVDVAINGKSYKIACDDGQEDHLLKLASNVDQRVQQLAASVGQVGDARLLVMACLLISDELSELPELPRNGNNLNTNSTDNVENDVENTLVYATNDLAIRIERIAEMLDPA